ncbi:hypothetical protein ABI59_00100 [Acidobacteria bacterium Mor1]|nr:hypothetical protein ABI59_00100 [Acidobacteria bacterium Mor1]
MPSFGEELKRERELRKITLREVSEATKINLRYLEALERNDFSHLPGGVFNKGFVRAVAQFIGIDADSMVDAYLHEQLAQADVVPAESEPGVMRGGAGGAVKTPPQPPASAPAESGDAPTRSIVPWLLAGVLLAGAVGFAGYAWYQQSARNGDAPQQAESGGTDAPERNDSSTPSAPDRSSEPENPPVAGTDDEASDDAEGASPAAADPAPREDPPPPGGESARSPQSPPPSVTASSGAAEGVIRARFVLDRRTTGRLNCDNRRVEALEGLPLGEVIEMNCRRFLVVDAADGGSLRVGVGGKTPATVVSDGTPLVGYRVLPSAPPGPDGRADS